MRGLIDAVEQSYDYPPVTPRENARAAVLAVADWLDTQSPVGWGQVADALRREVAPPPPPTAEDVIREWLTESVSTVPAPGQGANAARLAAALRDAGLLREDDRG